jgi:hypothetical protein
MKTKIAAALSIVGVLGAGSAAALVNTEILDGGPTDSGASAAVLPPASSIALTVPTTAGETERDSAEVSVPSITTPDTTGPAAPAAPAASGMLTAFNVGDAGVVTVDVIDGRLLLVSAEPKPGWTVTKEEDDSTDDSDDVEDEVEVDFTSTTVRVEFEAHLVDGEIVPEVESTSLAASSAPPTSAAANTVPSNTVPSNTVDDHDDDDIDDDDIDDDHDDDDIDDDAHDDDSDDDDSDDDDSDDDDSDDDDSDDIDDDSDDDDSDDDDSDDDVDDDRDDD